MCYCNKMLKLTVTLLFLGAVCHAVPFLQTIEEFPDLEIVGGNVTDILQHPWQISLRQDGDHICGGSIILDSWVVTAAHCVVDQEIENLAVKVGSTFLSSGGEMYNVEKAIVHSGFDLKKNKNYKDDIALIKVDKAINHPNASTINLPPQDEELEVGTNITITGWGYIMEIFGPLSEILLEVTIPTVSQEDCIAIYSSAKVTDGMLCAGLLETGGKNSCQGDSGGPVAIENELYGIVSWSNGCAEPHYPGVYTKVSKYIDWINNNVAEIENSNYLV